MYPCAVNNIDPDIHDRGGRDTREGNSTTELSFLDTLAEFARPEKEKGEPFSIRNILYKPA